MNDAFATVFRVPLQFFFFPFLNSHYRLLSSVASFNDKSLKLNKNLFMIVTVFM